MPLYQPKELLQFLSELGVEPKKGLSQNFLIDGNVLRKLLHCAQVGPEDLVLEIGPGPGALTEQLLAAGAAVIAIEKDRHFAQALRRLEKREERLMIYSADALKVDFQQILHAHPLKRKVKVIANLPYHITTPIIERLIAHADLFSGLWLMVQDEVAKRFVAKKGTSDYGSLTLFLNFYATVSYGFFVSRNCFYPVPGVDSAIAQLLFKAEPNVSDKEEFFQLMRLSFQQKRKMLTSSLGKVYVKEHLLAALSEIGVPVTARPQELDLAQFISLYEAYRRRLIL